MADWLFLAPSWDEAVVEVLLVHPLPPWVAVADDSCVPLLSQVYLLAHASCLHDPENDLLRAWGDLGLPASSLADRRPSLDCSESENHAVDSYSSGGK